MAAPIDEIARALESGALASRSASRPPEGYPVAAPSGPPETFTAIAVRFAVRHKWALIGLGLFLLYEIVMLTAGSSMGMHF